MEIIDIWSIFDDFFVKTMKKSRKSKKNGKNATYVYKNLSYEHKTIVHFLMRWTTSEQKNTQKIPIYGTLIHQKSMIYG